jgi:hypothetical protein
MSPRKKLVFAGLAAFLGLVMGTLLAEAAMRGIDAQQAARARPALDYGDTWRTSGIGPGGFLRASLAGEVADGYGGTVRWVSNSAGFRSEREFTERPAPGVLRVLSLGDSFVVGLRVGQGLTFSDRVGQALESNGVRCEMLISCTESPDQGLEYLRSEGYKWNPHVVLLGVTLGNDIAQDYIGLHPGVTGFRHGLNRENLPDRCLSQRTPNLFERAMARIRTSSHLARRVFPERAPISPWYGKTRVPKMFDPSTGLGFFIAPPPPIIEEAFARHCRVLAEFNAFCRAREINFIAVLLPQRFQVQPEDWTATVVHYQLNAGSFDLRLPNRLIGEYCRRASIPLIDPTDYMASAHTSSGIDMYLPLGDMHFNQEGHRVCSEGIWVDLRPKLAAAVERGALTRSGTGH